MSVVLKIEGMSCSHCVRSVRNALEEIPGVHVTDVQVGSATVETEGTPPPIEAIKAALDDAGYAAEVGVG
jgi:copper chaperone